MHTYCVCGVNNIGNCITNPYDDVNFCLWENKFSLLLCDKSEAAPTLSSQKSAGSRVLG